MRLVDEGVAPAETELDAIGWMFATAEHVARKYGARVLSLVRTTAHALMELIDGVLARNQRNMPWLLAAAELIPPEWSSALMKAAGNVGLGVGAAALRDKLSSYGVGADMVGYVEQELNREGLSLGALAHPPKLATFASFAQPK
jgi:hypothetical protein